MNGTGITGNGDWDNHEQTGIRDQDNGEQTGIRDKDNGEQTGMRDGDNWEQTGIREQDNRSRPPGSSQGPEELGGFLPLGSLRCLRGLAPFQAWSSGGRAAADSRWDGRTQSSSQAQLWAQEWWKSI